MGKFYTVRLSLVLSLDKQNPRGMLCGASYAVPPKPRNLVKNHMHKRATRHPAGQGQECDGDRAPVRTDGRVVNALERAGTHTDGIGALHSDPTWPAGGSERARQPLKLPRPLGVGGALPEHARAAVKGTHQG